MPKINNISVKKKTVLLSICIVNWNTREYLEQCLKSIYAVKRSISFETIVVENASLDSSAEMVTQKFPQVRLIRNNDNRGYAHGNNQALAIRRGKYVLFLNPDTIIPADVLKILIDRMQSDLKIGILTCQLRNMDDSIQNFCSGLPTIYDEIFLQTGFDTRFPTNYLAGHRRRTDFNGNIEQLVEQPPGTFILTRSSVIEQIGGFDEQFALFYNDVDFCKRVKNLGLKIWFTPAVYIYHHKSASIKKFFTYCLQEAFYMRWRYYRKYFPQFYIKLLRWTAPFSIPHKNIIPNNFDITLDNTDRILIIKSAFKEHFEDCLNAVSTIFPNNKKDLLTTSDIDINNPDLRKWVTKIYFNQQSDFSLRWHTLTRNIRKKLCANKYALVLFPHGSVDGAGYWNIIFLASVLCPRYVVAFGIDKYFEMFKPRGLKLIRGILVFSMAYLLLLIGYGMGCIHYLNTKLRENNES